MLDYFLDEHRARRQAVVDRANDAIAQSGEWSGWLEKIVATIAVTLILVIFTLALVFNLARIVMWDVPTTLLRVLVLSPLLAIWLVPGRGFSLLLTVLAGMLVLSALCVALVRTDQQMA